MVGCTKRYTDPSSLRKHVKNHSNRDQVQARRKSHKDQQQTLELDGQKMGRRRHSEPIATGDGMSGGQIIDSTLYELDDVFCENIIDGGTMQTNNGNPEQINQIKQINGSMVATDSTNYFEANRICSDSELDLISTYDTDDKGFYEFQYEQCLNDF